MTAWCGAARRCRHAMRDMLTMVLSLERFGRMEGAIMAGNPVWLWVVTGVCVSVWVCLRYRRDAELETRERDLRC